jgi:hypothetical protein
VPRRPHPETLLFWGLLALHLLPIWIFPFTPTQDGPGHQAVTAILRQYDLPEAGLLRQYYLPNREALPNWLIFFLMARVLRFLTVPMAEKVVLTAYVLLLPLAARYALRAVNPRAGFLAVMAFPFVYNYLFNMGFFNFCWSLAAFFFAVGYWLRHGEQMGPGRTVVLALLMLWVYFCHPVTLAVNVAVLLTLAVWRMLLDLRATPGRPASGELWRAFRHRLLAPALACVPPLALIAAFVGRRTGARISMMPMWVKLKQLAGLYSLSSLTRWTIPLAILLAFLFYWLAALCQRERRGLPLQTGDGFLIATGILTVVHFAAPSELAGGGFINQRTVLYPFLTLLLWLGTFEHPARRRLRVQIAAAGIALAFLGLILWKYAQLDRFLSEIVATSGAVEPDHTLLFLSYSHRGDGRGGDIAYRTEPLLHAGGYVAARKRLVDLSLYEANEDYFPILFHPSLNPYRHLSDDVLGIEKEPPEVDLLSYPRRTGGRIDYVLLWGLRDDRRGEPKVRAVLDQVAAGFDLVERSPGGGAVLYRARR